MALLQIDKVDLQSGNETTVVDYSATGMYLLDVAVPNETVFFTEE
jgi:hypothetical protein